MQCLDVHLGVFVEALITQETAWTLAEVVASAQVVEKFQPCPIVDFACGLSAQTVYHEAFQ